MAQVLGELTIGYPIWMVPLFLLAAAVLTTEYVTEIDLEKREYRDFISLLWIPFDEEKTSFTTLTKIIITGENFLHDAHKNYNNKGRAFSDAEFKIEI
jgi:hypothetical protein